MKKTDFFIIGAPKSGTTSLCNYLDQHPDICISNPKEPDYFGSDLLKPDKPKTKEEYLSCFKGGSTEQLWGEGSTIYWLSQKAPQEIYDFNPQAKIIVMLREPVSLLYSLHSQLIFDLHEDITDFKLALEAEKERKQGKKIPPKCRRLNLLFYSEVVHFTDHLKRYLNVFGSNKVKIIIFDDFVKDTANVYRETLDFLSVNSNFQPSFNIYNANKTISNFTLYQFFRDPPPWIFAMGRMVTPSCLVKYRRKLGWNFIKTQKLLTPNKSRSPLDPELYQQLQYKFEKEVNKLSCLLERDLSEWKSRQE